MGLEWLPVRPDWDARLRAVRGWDVAARCAEVLAELRALAQCRMEMPQMVRLDRVLRDVVGRMAAGSDSVGGSGSGESQTRGLALAGLPGGFERVRVGVVGSSTLGHLMAGLRVAGLRRGLVVQVYEAPFGVYRQEIFGAESGLARFRPEALVVALDARHVAGFRDVGAAVEAMRACWREAKRRFGCQVVQQTVLPVLPGVMGNHEERAVPAAGSGGSASGSGAGSAAGVVWGVNTRLREVAAEDGVDLVSVDRMAAEEGIGQWYEAGLWFHAKTEVHPRQGEMWGEAVMRVVGAARGRSAKALVLDLDNTVWGGVVGDDGVEGLALGQGTARGEAFAEFQAYAKALARRGVVLAVCSKNEEQNAREPFERHPETVLRCGDFACFTANWTDKATNLRDIARKLNLGLDALVFADDNPVERELVRRELPEVLVPELPEDPAEYARVLARAGYFESLGLTEEDARRGEMYRANARRAEALGAPACEAGTDLAGYLRSLGMVLRVGPVDAGNVVRVAQLVNKTNQFNVLTVRRTEAEVRAMAADPAVVTLAARLEDRFGENGLIAVVMVRVEGEVAAISDWLMSCRVLGRRVEEGCLAVLVEACRRRGVRRLTGRYRATAKNGMVADLYPRLGFVACGEEAGCWSLNVEAFGGVEDLPMRVEVSGNGMGV